MHLEQLCLFVVETSRLIPISMAHVETLRQTWARADQEAHASFNVQCETDLNEQAFRSEVVPNAGMFTDMIKREIDRINKISGSGNMGGLHPAVRIA